MVQAALQYAASSIDPLPADVRNGMIAMGSVGLLSTISTLSLIVFITYRMIYWRQYYEHSIATNQIFILIYNLLLADFQQALSFLFSFYWIAQDKLVGPSNVCFAQGWLIQIGDLSSGLWVLAIAVHTFVGLVLQRQIPFPAFIAGVITLWVFCLVLTAVGPIMHQKDFFVPAGVWCWIGENHERDRLTLHYLWIFVSQLGSLVTYLAIFFFLRIKLASSAISHHQPSSHASNPANLSSNTSPIDSIHTAFSKMPRAGTTTTIQAHDPFLVSRQKILRTARYMVVYPFAYVALTLPLAAGRVSAMARKTPPMVFYCVAGTLMASCGVIDVALYIYTRKALVRSNVGMKRLTTSSVGGNMPLRSVEGEEDWDGNSDSRGIPLGGIGESDEELSKEQRQGEQLGMGKILISQSVTTRSEERLGGVGRSESLRSLVGERNGSGSGPGLAVGRDKSWLA